MAPTLTSTKSGPPSSVTMLIEADKAARSRMEAAEALLGVSPNTTATTIPVSRPAAIPFTSGWETALEAPAAPGHFKFQLPFPAPEKAKSMGSKSVDRPASGLEALAMLASSVEEMDMDANNFSHDESDTSAIDTSSSPFATKQQPHRQRPRSVSNPEGMEKWDSLRHAASTLDAMSSSPPASSRSSSSSILSNSSSLIRHTCRKAHHFMQPTIFEDSVLDHTTTTDKELRSRTPSPSSVRSRVRTRQQGPLKKRMTKVSFASTNENKEHVVPRYIKDMDNESKQEPDSKLTSSVVISGTHVSDPVTQSTMAVKVKPKVVEVSATHLESDCKPKTAVEIDVEAVKNMAEEELKELLSQARSKLMDDVVTSEEARTRSDSLGSAGSIAMNSMVLPHDLTKYRDVYNKNGRIGVYTPSERAAIIARFQAKRSRRVWNKKIRYSCRKDLADKRLRVKGRFVKRVPDSGDAGASHLADPTRRGLITPDDTSGPENGVPLCSRSPSPPELLQLPVQIPSSHCEDDTHMPDVEDEEAEFCPTDDLPFRRTRRHTIT